MIHGLEVLDLLSGLEDVILRGTEGHCLLTLGLGTGKDDDLAPHCGSQFDGQVTKATNAHNCNAVGRANTVLGQDSPDSCTGTHQRGCIRQVIFIGNGDDAAGIPNDTLAEGSQIVIVTAIFLFVLAILVPA